MFKIIQNIFKRIFKNKGFLFTPLIMLPVLVIATFFIVQTESLPLQIGVVGNVTLGESEHFEVIELEKVPPTSALFEGTYDAIVVESKGEVVVETVKVDWLKHYMEAALDGEVMDIGVDEQERGIYTRFFGIASLFLFLFGTLIFQYYHDEMRGMSKRMLMADVSIFDYTAAHSIVVFVLLFVPTMIALSLGSRINAFESMASLLDVTLLIAVFSFFVASFGLLLASIFNSDEDALTWSMIFGVIGTFISGSFAPIISNRVIDRVALFFPQTHLMSFISKIEMTGSREVGSLLYVLFFSICAFILGTVLSNKKAKQS